ncbi:hypothetical protein RCCS2_15179 [Roseobacter sp. CCS2]|nr:hypothetical protein RCCS2_15179 [Roseobacter sp. CCS2]
MIEFSAGFVIVGQTTFTYDDGTAGDVTLIAEADGHRIEYVDTFAPNGEVMKAKRPSGLAPSLSVMIVSPLCSCIARVSQSLVFRDLFRKNSHV